MMGDEDQGPIILPNRSLILPNRSLTSADQDFMAGSFMCGSCAVGLFGYIPVLFVLVRSTTLKHPVYGLIISLGVTDCASLVIWFTAGIFTFSHGTLFNQIVIDWLMVIVVYGWYSLVCHVAAISFNRYLAVCRPASHHRWFQSQFQSKHWVILTCGLAFLVNILSYIPPGTLFAVDGWYFNWKDEGVRNFYWYFDQGLCSLVFLLMIGEYSAIIRSVRKSDATVRNYRSRSRGAQEVAREAAAERKRQISLCVQCGLVGICFWLNDILFYAAPAVFADYPVVVFFCSSWLWIFNNSMNPWLYLVFNSRLRKEVKKTFLGNNAVAVAKVTPF